MLTVEHVSVNYGESRILADVSLSVPAGEVVCLMGRNGVGKTTLLKAIMGVLKPWAGRMTFEGQELTSWSPSQRARAGIGYVPQGRGIFPYLTVYENLLMGPEARGDRHAPADAVEEMYELFPVVKQMRARTAGTLSGGQQQQLALARALVRRPKLLVLDEPTEGIQPSIMLEIESVLLALREQRQMGILVVEQFLDFALAVASYHYIMETGAIVHQGPIENFDRAV